MSTYFVYKKWLRRIHCYLFDFFIKGDFYIKNIICYTFVLFKSASGRYFVTSFRIFSSKALVVDCLLPLFWFFYRKWVFRKKHWFPTFHKKCLPPRFGYLFLFFHKTMIFIIHNIVVHFLCYKECQRPRLCYPFYDLLINRWLFHFKKGFLVCFLSEKAPAADILLFVYDFS